MFCGFETRDYTGENSQEENEYDERGCESDNSSEFDIDEIEIALYSKLHFVPGDVDTVSQNANENNQSTDMTNENESVFDKYSTSVFYEANHTHRNVDCSKIDEKCQSENKTMKVIDKETKSPNQKEATKLIQPVIISDSEIESDSKYGIEKITDHRKNGLSQEQAIDISDSESELQNFICIDSISNDSDSSMDKDTISISSTTSLSSFSESSASTDIRRQTKKRTRLCDESDDMVLDEALEDVGDMQFNVIKGQEELLIKSLPISPIVTNTEDDKWAISERDRQATNPLLNRYYNPITVRCYNCRELGHISNACPKPKKCEVCYLCGNTGHNFRNCPKSICYNCYAPADHSAKDCPKPHRITNQECHRCLMYGHIKSECPDQWRQYHRTTSYDHFKNTKEKQNPRTYCYNCASSKHFGFECSRKRMNRHSTATYPFIALYKDTLKFYRRKQDFDEEDERPKKKVKKSDQNDDNDKQCETKQKGKKDVKLHKDKHESSKMSKPSGKSQVKEQNSRMTHIEQKRTNETNVRSVKASKKGTSKEENLTVTVTNSISSDKGFKRKGGSNVKHTAEKKCQKKGSSKVKDITVTVEKDFPRTPQKTSSKSKKTQDCFIEDDIAHQAFNNKWWEGSVTKKKKGASKKKRQKIDCVWERFSSKPASREKRQKLDCVWDRLSDKPYKSDRGFQRRHF